MERQSNGGFGIEQAKTIDRIERETAAKFRFFFTGLTFAILSFAIQFPIKNAEIWIKVLEAWSWVLIAITGMFSLIDIGGFSATDGTRLTTRYRKLMWFLFFIGVSLLLTAKTIASLKTTSVI